MNFRLRSGRDSVIYRRRFIIPLIKPKAVNATSLRDELVDARQAFIETRDSVIARASDRSKAIDQTIADLQSERNAHESVIADAKSL